MLMFSVHGLVGGGRSHLRYMNGNAPLGNTPLYTLSIARLMLDDSTRRSAMAHVVELPDVHATPRLTYD